MAAPSNKKSGVGFRHCQIFALDSNGMLAASNTTAYEGLQVSGVRSLTLDIPDPTKINHVGDDRVFAIDQLPPKEGASGQMVVGKNNFDVDALATGAKAATIGEAKFFGRGTDKQGSEAQLCMLVWRQALNTEPGASRVRYWDIRLLPICQIIPKNPGFSENPEEMTYTIWPQVVAKYPWGVAFTEATEGMTEAQILDATTIYKPKLIAFKGSGAATVFNLPATAQAVSTSKMKVWHYVALTGVTTDVTSTVTLAVGSVTFSVAPAADDIVTCWYETA